MTKRTYADRMYDRQKTLDMRIHDTHSAALIYQSSFDDYLISMGRIFNSNDYKSLPRYSREYLRGVYDTLFHQLQNSLVWILNGPDGVRYGPDNDEWLKQDTAYKEAMAGQHVWPKAWAKGEYKQF